ncbi:MAG: DUF116 domain-containing protein [Nitrospirae bacterium]|nr:DUF116 domain-containing protein [Nitrospirota bacterium]
MAEKEETDRIIIGKTYSLDSDNTGAGPYYLTIRKLADLFLQKCPDEKNLLSQIRKAGSGRSFTGKLSGNSADKSRILFIKKTLKEFLSVYTTGVKQHLRTLPLSKRFDETLRTKEEQYHLYMLEIELVNRIYREAFKQSEYKFALMPHCLRDFRPECRAVSGEIESVCMGCTIDCFINLGGHLLRKYNIHPYISVSMDLDKLFRKLKSEHPDIGALGIACVPELAMGMRLCNKLDINPVGIPLDANRCSRWMKQCLESSFSLNELERLIR